MSLSDFRVTAVVPVRDIGIASDFYEDVLGLSVRDSNQFEIVYQCAQGSSLQIYLTDVGSSAATVATWEVTDIVYSVARLREAGVVFEEYPEMTVDGIATDEEHGMKAAWFKDPDGNFLCLHQKL